MKNLTKVSFERAFCCLKNLIEEYDKQNITGVSIHMKRECWNADEFVVLQKGYPQGIPSNKQTAIAWGIEEGSLFKCEPYLQKQVNGTHVMWTPNTEELFANDWQLTL